MPKSGWLLDVPVGATNAKADTPLFPFLSRLTRGEDLSFDEASEFFRALTAPDANPVQIAGCLVALAAKGETFEELAGMARVMRERAVKITARQKNLIDITGTGSSPAKTFNVSTAAAFVAAGAGLTVAKHGNRAVTSRTGSADVLAKLGVKVASEPEVAQTSLSGAGICFMFGPKFHPALRRVGDIRRALGIRTSLNLLGVLANPANPMRRLLGVWHPSLVRPIAQALALLGTERSWVVHGSDGLDELTLSGPTSAVEITGNKLREFQISPADFKLKEGSIEHLRTHSADESAAIIRDVLSSKRRDEARSLIVLNAAAALVIGGVAKDPIHAARLAEQAIDSGQAQNKLDRLIQTTNKR
ncbi:MAG: anthranilate phosphoribosyltransferase [Acidobacteria bacterium]|nr:anthranilate phosphoribosyltransferase [Acidobacteriota bacterium]